MIGSLVFVAFVVICLWYCCVFVRSYSDEYGCEWIVVCDLFVFCCVLVEYCWCMSILSMMNVLLYTAAQKMPMICMLCVKAQKIHTKATTYLRVVMMLSHLRPHVHKNQLKAFATSQKRHQTSYSNTKNAVLQQPYQKMIHQNSIDRYTNNKTK